MARSDRIQIDSIIDRLDGLSERAVKKITLDVTANLVEATPRDTGWAAANWVPAIGVEDKEQASSNADPEAVPAQKAEQQAGIATVATSYTLEMGSVFVSNNVPYIPKLNEGSSKQAPKGFVQDAIRKAITRDLRGI